MGTNLEVWSNNIMKSLPTLKTERLTLKGITESDADTIVNLRSIPEVYRYFLNPHQITKEEHLRWYFGKYIQDNNRLDWIGIDSNQKSIGIFGVKRNASDGKEAEISYILDQKEYGKGYASEAIHRLTNYCKRYWKIETFIADIHVDNLASIHFIEKQGYFVIAKFGDFLRYKKLI